MTSIEAWSEAIRPLIGAIDNGVTVAPAAMRAHVEQGDLLEWLDLGYPDHFHFGGLDEMDRQEILDALTLDASHDWTDAFGPRHNGLAMMVAYLAHAIGKEATGRW